MFGVSTSSRRLRQIEGSLSRLENDPTPSAAEVIGVLEELRRLEREWHEPAAAPARWVRWLMRRSTAWSVDADLQALHRCYHRWKIASRRVDDPQVTHLRQQLDREFRGL